MACDAYAAQSPENAAFAWCGRYRVNLDRAGRFCARCVSDAAFGALLRRQYAARFGAGCEGTRSYCEIFQMPTTQEQCARCTSDPLYRAFLRGQGGAGQTSLRWRECVRRGAELRREERVCCGGKCKEISIVACALRGEAQDADCCRCIEVELPRAAE